MRRSYMTRRAMRYSTQLEEEVHELVGLTVHELEPRVRSTGLLDASGEEIMVVERMGPIGFHHFES